MPKAPKRIVKRLVIDIDYAPKGTSSDKLDDVLMYMAQDAASAGWFVSGGSKAEVAVWESAVFTIPEVSPRKAMDLQAKYDALVEAARGVVKNWETGDLAAAVRNLDDLLPEG